MDGCIAVQADQSEQETHFLLEMADQHPFVKGVVGWVNLQADNIAERLETFRSYRSLCGFRHIVQAETDPDFLQRPAFQRGIALLEDLGYSYDILVYPHQLPAVHSLLERFPRQRFVIDHLAKPSVRTGTFEPWATWMTRIARHKQVFCKLSGLVTEADWQGWSYDQFVPYLDHVTRIFGPERLLFGSDWPVCLLAADYRQVLDVVLRHMDGWTPSDRDMVMGSVAAHCYHIKD
jgi:L-fuconolactonase